MQLHVCIANVHLNILDNIYCTFEKLFFLYIIFTVTSSFSRNGPYLKDTIKYKLIDIEANSNIWEGQFIEIEKENVGKKKIILGNVYRPRDTNENYNQFINEFFPMLSDFGKSKSDVIIAGDYNIDLLKVLEKPVIGEYLMRSLLSIFPEDYPSN